MIGDFARGQESKISRLGPARYAEDVALRAGIGCIIVGALMWVAGGVLGKAAANADQDAGAALASVSASFGNVGAAEAGASATASAILDQLVGVANTRIQTASVAPNFEVQLWDYLSGKAPGEVSVTIGITDSAGNAITDALGLKWSGLTFTGSESDPIPSSYDGTSGLLVIPGVTPRLSSGATYIVTVSATGRLGGKEPVQLATLGPGVFQSSILTSQGAFLGAFWGSSPSSYGSVTNAIGLATNGGWATLSPQPSTQGDGSTNTTQTPGWIGAIAAVVGATTGAWTALSDLPAAIYTTATVLPRLAVDALSWGIGSLGGYVGATFGPWVLGIGAVLLGASITIRFARVHLYPPVADGVSGWVHRKVDEPLRERVNAFFGAPAAGNGPQGSPVPPSGASGSAPDTSGEAKAPDPAPTPPPSSPGESSVGPATGPGGQPPAVPTGGPGALSTNDVQPPSDRPLPLGTPTSEVEEALAPTAIEPTAEELREMERQRLASMPEPEEPEPEPEEEWGGQDEAAAADKAFAALEQSA